MYQIGIKWKLWDLSNLLEDEIKVIQLRGYKMESPVVLPSDFHVDPEDPDHLSLSVEQAARAYCPTYRDIYIKKRMNSQINNSISTWGQIAGILIEEYYKGLLVHFDRLAKNPQGLNYQSLQKFAEKYSRKFWSIRQEQVDKLRKKATSSEELPERLIFILQQTVKYELTMLSADYSFCQNYRGKFVPLMQRIPIVYDDNSVKIKPNKFLGLGDTTTPDFFIKGPMIVMGEVKTGLRLEPYHLHTIAGYALAYESQYNMDVNFGIVYFFETHSKQMNFPQCYIFVIDDFLRRGFLDQRNKKYTILLQSKPPKPAREVPKYGISYFENYCEYCKYKPICYAKKS